MICHTHSHCTRLPYLDNSAARVHDLGSRSQHRADCSRQTPGHDWTNALRLWRQFLSTPPIAAIENRTGVWMIYKWSTVCPVELQLLRTALWMCTALRKAMPASPSHGAARGLTPNHGTIIIWLLHTKCLCASATNILNLSSRLTILVPFQFFIIVYLFHFTIFHFILGCCHNVAWKVIWLVNDELEGIWKEAILV
jgi:hypothetical protein